MIGATVFALPTVRLTAFAKATAVKTADPTHAQAVAQSVWDGVYTLAQAKRGALKSGLCTSCHGDGFVGGSAPELAAL